MRFARGLALMNMRVIGTTRGPNQPGKDRGPHTLPFHRPKTHATLSRGFTRQAELVEALPTGASTNAAGCTFYRCACSLYKDKCMFFLLHTAHVEAAKSDDVIMRGEVGGGKAKKAQQLFVAHQRYNEYYGGVDMLDASVGFFGIHKTIKPERWYLRPAFWILDVLANNMWQIALHHIDGGTSAFYQQFKEGPRVGNHRLFLITLGRDLITKGEELNRLAPEQEQVPFTPLRLRTPRIFEKAAAEIREKHELKRGKGTPKPDTIESDDADEPEAVGPKRKRQHRFPTPTVTITTLSGHEMQAVTKKRCAGCSMILKRNSNAFGERGRDAIPQVRQGCVLCKVALPATLESRIRGHASTAPKWFLVLG